MSFNIIKIEEGVRKMDLVTISEVSKNYNISTRTLRYYEEIGLIKSCKKEGYAYRAYNEEELLRLQQIMILRKLYIPLKEIGNILDNREVREAINIFRDKVDSIEEKIKALNTIRDIINSLIVKLGGKEEIKTDILALQENSIMDVINSLPKLSMKEERSIENLKKANKKLEKLSDVRIVNIPPCTVAASHYFGENPEENAKVELDKFLKDSKLYEVKPDARVFGFNHPNPSENTPCYGYELWVTIPEDMEVPSPLKKKHFNGGLYAAHMITFPNFHEWELIHRWVQDSEVYNENCIDDNGEVMGGCLEEHLNYVYYANLNWPEYDAHQLDLLEPICNAID